MAEEFESLWGGEQAEARPGDQRRVKELKYWKRPDGWVGLGPRIQSDPYDYQRYIQVKRWRELPDSFGYEPVGKMGPDSMTRGQTRFRKFVANGGIRAVDTNGDFGPAGAWIMPGPQVVTLLWHRDPGVRDARPDVAENAVDLECPYGCTDSNTASGKRLFHGWGENDARKSLNAHITAAHEDAVAAEAVGKQNQTALVEAARIFSGNGSNQGFDPNQMAEIMAKAMVMAQAMMAQQNTSPYEHTVSQSTVAELPPEPEAKPTRVKPPAPAGGWKFDPDAKPDMSWRRNDLLSWLKANGYPMPNGFSSWNHDEVLTYVEEVLKGFHD